MRNSEEMKKEAFRYYCLGLTSKEIGKLVGVSYRTIQGYMSKDNWKAKKKRLKELEVKRIIRRYLKSVKNESKSN